MSFVQADYSKPGGVLFITNKSAIGYKVIHTLFWISVTIIFLYDRQYLITKAGLPHFFICSFIRITLLIALAYTNLYYLMPRYLLKEKYWQYFSLVILALIFYLGIQFAYDWYLFNRVIGAVNSNVPAKAILDNLVSTIWYLIISITFKFSLDWYQQYQQLQKAKMEKLKAEINFLKAQISPHFLFNILNNLYSLTLEKSDEAPEMVLRLSQMMEYMLCEADQSIVFLDKEIQYLENYIELERCRYGNNANIKFEIKGTPDGHQIAPFLFLPLIENAFKHGMSRSIRNTYFHARLSINRDSVSLEVENNKPSSAIRDARQGIGIANLKKRLELNYPNQYIFEIKEEVDKFITKLKIQLI